VSVYVLFSSDLDDPEAWAATLKARRPEVELVDAAQVEGDRARFVFALMWKPPAEGLAGYPNIKAIQSLGAGVNQLDLSALPPGVPLARLIDRSLTDSMVDYAVAAVTRHFRELDRFERDSRAAIWDFRPARRKRTFTLGILGTGALGGAMAETLSGLGFPVVGWSRSGRPLPGVEVLSGRDGLAALAARASLVLCILPLTPETEGVIDAGFLAQMPAGGYLVNLGRGGHVVDADLLAALDSGHLAGATLDVTSAEPLPSDHPFFGRPDVLVTPHVAGHIDPESAADAVLENLDRALAGRPLLHQVDVAKGY
jgi:glyoxylate/hydroxypyruvate reductase A